MKAKEIRDLMANARETDAASINAQIASLEEERFRLTFRSGTEELENPLRLRDIRRTIARLKTVQTERKKQNG